MRLKYCLSLAPSATEAKSLSDNDPVSFAPMDAIDNGLGGLSGLTDKPLSEVTSGSYNFFRNGDLLLSKVTPCFENGKKAIAAGLTNDVGYATSEVFVVRPTSIDPRYLNYLFSSEEFRQPAISSMTGTGGLKRVDPDAVKNFELPVLEREQQELIADFLDQHCGRTESLISEKKNFISLLKEKRQALISHVVTKGLDSNVEMKYSGLEWIGEIPKNWELKKLKHITSKIGSGKTPPGGSESYVSEGIVFLRSQNIHNDGLRLTDVVRIAPEVDEEMRGSRVLPKDVLLNITGASIGRSCITPSDMEAANVNQHVCIIRLCDKKQSEFVSFVMTSESIQYQVKLLQTGAGREGLNFSQIGSFYLALPPEQEREWIIEYLRKYSNKIDDLISETKISIELLKEHRTALIGAAVTGKIDLRDKEVA